MVLPREVTISPREPGAAIRLCPNCADKRIDRNLTFIAAGNSLQLRTADSNHSFSAVSFEGDYELAMPGRPPVLSRYPGTLQARSGRIRAVLRVPLEDYVILALEGEAADFKSDAALEAMAVTVRTYAAGQRGRHAAQGFDLCDTTHCQLLRWDDAAPARLRAAAEATEGELLWYRGEPAAAFYSRNCGGTTEDGAQVWPGLEAPYLRSHADPYCLVHGRNEWSAEIDIGDLTVALRAAGVIGSGDAVSALRILQRTPSGRVARIEIRSSKTRLLTGEQFRTALAGVMGSGGLRSNAFDVQEAGGRFLFHGYGAGHGAGLCQAGADEMGAEGKTYRQILAFYYPGTAIGLTAQGLVWARLGGERVDLVTTRPDADHRLVPLADSLLRAAESLAGWQLASRPEVRVYPTVAVFRNATGEPGWVAASTRGRVVRLEPVEVLNAAGVLHRTLRHEFLHLLVESRARPGLPLWFREGLVLYLSGEMRLPPEGAAPSSHTGLAALDRTLLTPASAEAQRYAYREAQRAVARLAEQRGRAEVLSWLERGLPPDLGAHH
jgi:stage II sporulation protein D (peptidoglycan lytic transglycosylase)